jgi:hypothetical protein
LKFCLNVASGNLLSGPPNMRGSIHRWSYRNVYRKGMTGTELGEAFVHPWGTISKGSLIGSQ